MQTDGQDAMGSLSGWEWVLFVAAAWVAVVSLARLMAARREQLVHRYLAEAEAERQRQENERIEQARQARKRGG